MLGFALRAAIMYFMALIMIRLLGKRALGELGPFDFVVMTGVGHTVVSIALDKSIPYYEGIIILATLAGLEYIMGFLALKNEKLSNLIVGKPVVLIESGRIIKKNLAKEKFNVDDLLQELRKKGIRDIDEVEIGILESCGGFSVIIREDDEPVTKRDLGIKSIQPEGALTFTLKGRGKIFEQQQGNAFKPDPEIDLPGILQAIQKQLEQISERIYHLENQKDT
ncbi:MAG: DUF421 domain-containing protein [Syntrophomonadaceae bacterium]|nr:DUF421 domain-containing protein [Syntrophomonadaceae bacterium]